MDMTVDDSYVTNPQKLADFFVEELDSLEAALGLKKKAGLEAKSQ